MQPKKELKKAYALITIEANRQSKEYDSFQFDAPTYREIRKSLLNAEKTTAPKGFLKECLDEIRLDDVEPTGTALDLYLELIERRLYGGTLETFRNWLIRNFEPQKEPRQEPGETISTPTAYSLTPAILNASSLAFYVC